MMFSTPGRVRNRGSFYEGIYDAAGLHVSHRSVYGQSERIVEDSVYRTYIEELLTVPEKIEEVLKQERQIADLAKKYYKRDNIFFIGRGMDAAVSYEGSLKLKEISYINSFAIAAGELKHGTIALIEDGTLVVKYRCAGSSL